MVKAGELDVLKVELKMATVKVADFSELASDGADLAQQMHDLGAVRLGAFLKEHPLAWRDMLNLMTDALVYAHGELPKKFPVNDKRNMADKEATLGLAEFMNGLASLRQGHLFDSGGSLMWAAGKAKNAGALVNRAHLDKSIAGAVKPKED